VLCSSCFFLGLWRQSAFASAAKLFAQVSDVAGRGAIVPLPQTSDREARGSYASGER
jgi:hypothetical protein